MPSTERARHRGGAALFFILSTAVPLLRHGTPQSGTGPLALGDGDGVKMDNAIAKCGVLKRKTGMLRRKESR